MRWVRFEHDGGAAAGVIDGDVIERVEGDMFGDWQRTGETVALAEATLLIPFEPVTFYAAGLNYLEHVKEQAEQHGRALNVPEKPDIGYRANNALIAHGEEVVIPADATDKVQYEAELVVVIGKRAKHLDEANALDCVFGYTIGNDVSERTWQRGDRTLWRAKNTDTFAPMGPWIETDVDLPSLTTIVRVNGQPTIEFATNNMLFGVARYLAAMSRYVTLVPGDMMWMGTEGSSPDLVHGDVVDIEINQIGCLSNRFVREGA